MNKEEFFTYLGVTEEELAHMSIPQIPDDRYCQVEDYSLDDVDSLPDNLLIGGDLGLSYTKLKGLPENLTVGRILDISHTDIHSIPESVVIGGALLMEHCPVEKLPDNLEIGFLYDDSDPNRVTMSGGWHINHIAHFGCFRGLHIRECPLRELPKGLKIKGRLDISDTEISELPDDIESEGVIINRTQISHLPEHIHSLSCGLSADSSSLSHLNDDMTVRFFLSMSHTPIKELPRNLHVVEGNLNLSDTLITELPEDLVVDGYISIENAEVNQLPENLHCKGISVKGTPLADTYKSKNSRRWAKEKHGWNIILEESRPL